MAITGAVQDRAFNSAANGPALRLLQSIMSAVQYRPDAHSYAAGTEDTEHQAALLVQRPSIRDAGVQHVFPCITCAEAYGVYGGEISLAEGPCRCVQFGYCAQHNVHLS